MLVFSLFVDLQFIRFQKNHNSRHFLRKATLNGQHARTENFTWKKVE